MKTFIGTKIIQAEPCSLKEFRVYREDEKIPIDDVEGYRMELDLSIDWLASVCNIPGLYPSGTTFSTGPNYYNVQSTAYMPLGGGVFTGPITGTCGYFDCFNATSLSGNVIYLSGVSLTDTFLNINSAISSATTAVQG